MFAVTEPLLQPVVSSLCSLGAKVNLHDKDGRNALYLAKRANNTAVLKLLRNCGAEVVAVDEMALDNGDVKSTV